MGATRVRIDSDDRATFPDGRIEASVVEGTTEAEVALQEREDEAQAMQDMARYARRVRLGLGLTQVEFARRIHVSHETIRNWEQGKRGAGGCGQSLAQGARQGTRDGPARTRLSACEPTPGGRTRISSGRPSRRIGRSLGDISLLRNP